ncbi:hypothetical protein BEP19_08620 [Ammoniphilus oxalaticus]|uniref:Nudix hydrolase domain-containing protein n=2 Tax=Ammoniphilus oxalaticus TaxID=66863 RepID=A0A419SKG4_9BACL|nr:hypothetical protein BEP19_08620 [Ammoniphilus oxalaticus]
MIEYIDVLDEDMKPIAVATREEVHQKGFWHQTFHCAVMLQEAGKNYIVFQRRHPLKKTFPYKLDISAAGHLLHGESVEDGVRELEEELGISVDYKELVYLGMHKGVYLTEEYWDREFHHIHLLQTDWKLSDFTIQRSELIGLYQMEWQSFQAFLKGERSTVEAFGYEYNANGMMEERRIKAHQADFAAQGACWDGYFTYTFEQIEKALSRSD